ncbi:TenA family protein [Streptomyces iconiensis]|uniref:Aminopyrimidine aminohydrolase n=1 Tax=Streptomyces iconiensis TaxID=1384038 RepID=A0ABT6ZQY5_9ACTN|nr:TenA family protein [Streptomyces iconiensis]MDJ1131477.1 TenA family protein [Streptomyces iconiensis]
MSAVPAPRSTPPPAAGRPGPLSARLRSRNKDIWEEALGMRFVHDVTTDALSDAVFARYLLFEREFVDTAARLAGAAVREAPTAQALAGHSRSLHALVTDQYAYFTRALETTGVPEVGQQAQEQAAVLTDVVLEAADTLGYPGIVTCMYAAESLYGTWCAAAERTPSARAEVADWVHLHTVAPFTTQLRFLEAEADALEILPETEEDLVALFGRVLTAELRFHDAAYLD